MDQELITRYIGQAPRLPADLRARIERAWGGDPVPLPAFADLDHALRLTGSWLALAPRSVAGARAGDDGGWEVQSVERSRIRAVQESPGLSANALIVLGS